MNRRTFLKSTLGMAAASLLPSTANAGEGLKIPLEDVRFGADNDAQTIIVYLMGGQGEIIGNMSNFDEVVKLDRKYENFLDDFTPTSDGFWSEAGGNYIQQMVDNGDATIFRTCEAQDVARSHLIRQTRIMRGNNMGYDSGMVTTLMHVLDRHVPESKDRLMPNVTFLDSNYQLLTDGATTHALPSHLKPVSFSYYDKTNPFAVKEARLAKYANETMLMELAERMNVSTTGMNPLISDMFVKRPKLEKFVEEGLTGSLPEGIDYKADVKGTIKYDNYNFGKLFEMAMRILISNPDTKVVSLQGGTWDDHSNALTLHKDRARYLFKAIKTAIDHAKAVGRDNINIVLFGDFGRNMTINRAYGWDHGKNQNVMWFGGNKYVNHQGVVGETELYTGYDRIFTRPKSSSYAFTPYSIAATFYRLNGISNPEVLTGGHPAIDPSAYTGTPFLKV